MNQLILQLLALQVVLPLVLTGLNAFLPSMSRAGLTVRSLAVLLLLAYVALAGVWLFPPWWTPYLLALIHVAGTLWAFHRRGSMKKTRRAWFWRAEMGSGILLAFVAALVLVPALEGRRPPPSPSTWTRPWSRGAIW